MPPRSVSRALEERSGDLVSLEQGAELLRAGPGGGEQEGQAVGPLGQRTEEGDELRAGRQSARIGARVVAQEGAQGGPRPGRREPDALPQTPVRLQAPQRESRR